jgi:hypothetical protein
MKKKVVKLLDDHDIEHSVKLRTTEAALRGLARLQKVGWESDGSRVRTVTVEIYEEPTNHYGQRQEAAGLVESAGKLSIQRIQERNCARLRNNLPEGCGCL